MAAENRNDDDTQAAPVTGEDLQRNRNARLALSVQVSRALRELGYCSLGATELPDTLSDKINWASAGRDRGLIMYRNPALRRVSAIALFASAIARVLCFAGVSSCDHDGERADSAPAVAPSNSVEPLAHRMLVVACRSLRRSSPASSC
jgi:hypothetical protein